MPTIGCLSNYAEGVVLQHVFNKATLSQPYLYAGLCTANPGETGTGADCNEVPNLYDYARANAWYWTTVVGAYVENSAQIVFPEASGSWGTVTHFVLIDAETYGTGNVIVYGVLATPREVISGSQPKFAVGEVGILFIW